MSKIWSRCSSIEIDADRLAIRNQIEASLQRLEKETLVNRNGEDYFFLTNEERDISREIKDVDLNAGEETQVPWRAGL